MLDPDLLAKVHQPDAAPLGACPVCGLPLTLAVSAPCRVLARDALANCPQPAPASPA